MNKIISKTVALCLCLVMVVCLFPAVELKASAAYSNGYPGGMAGTGNIVAHGLDVSAWQESGLNFRNIANAGYKFVILRCGTSYGKDKCFEEYYANAKAAGLDVGCYFYSYALNAATAQQEARSVLSWIEGKVFEYPVYFDFEDPTQIDLSYSLSAQICRGFMDVIKDNGYLAGLYSMSWILNRDWITTSGIKSTYEGWVAHVYSDANNTGITSGQYNIYKDRYASVYGMHQYSFTTYVNGVGPFDANVCYKDYPSIVKKYGFNGYDDTKPVISDVTYSEVSSKGYTVSCKVTDSSGIARVSFPTWTIKNGQDDLAANFMNTQQGTKNGDIYTFRVNTSDHNNETGAYVTHIYAEDYSGNQASLPLETVEVRNDGENPVISNVRYSNLSAQGYTISCEVTDDWGINSVAFPTWTTHNGQDDLAANFLNTQRGTKNGDTYTFRVNASEHNNESGEYVTHIYATDCAGNRVSLALNGVEVRNDTQKPVVSDVKISEVSAEGYTVSCTVTDDWGVNRVAFPAWTVVNGQDDLPELFKDTQLGTRNGSTFTFRVKASDHGNQEGEYLTHIYAIDCAGNETQVVLDIVKVRDGLDEITLIAASSYSADQTYVRSVRMQTTAETLLKEFENEVLELVSSSGTFLTGSDVVGTGTCVNLYEGSKLLDRRTVVIIGDVDGDGTVDNTDYLRIKTLFYENFDLSAAQMQAADVDTSGFIDTTDYMRIRAYFLGNYELYS